MKQKKLTVFLLLFSIPFLFAENWIGQAATYQLIEGSITASGEKFSNGGLTAASNGFKIGAVVEVSNANTGKSVKVRINDRIAGDSKYFILLSPAAAKAVDLEWETGLVVVAADFNSLNSTERLPVSGLLPDDKESEKYNYLPEIEWPEDVTEDVPEEKIVTTQVDVTEDLIENVKDANYKQVDLSSIDVFEEVVLMEPFLEPAYTPVMINKNTLPIIESEKLVETEIQRTPLVEPLTPVYTSKALSDNYIEVSIPQVALTAAFSPSVEIKKPELISAYKPEKIRKDSVNRKAEQLETTKVSNIRLFNEIPWNDKLAENKIYVKIFTSKKEDEFAVKFFNLKEIFKDIIPYKKGDVFYLFSAPIEENGINAALNAFRNFGFRDAYVIKGRTM